MLIDVANELSYKPSASSYVVTADHLPNCSPSRRSDSMLKHLSDQTFPNRPFLFNRQETGAVGAPLKGAGHKSPFPKCRSRDL